MSRMIKKLLAAILVTSMLLGSNGISFAAMAAEADSITSTGEAAQEAGAGELREEPETAENSGAGLEESTAEEEQVSEEDEEVPESAAEESPDELPEAEDVSGQDQAAEDVSGQDSAAEDASGQESAAAAGEDTEEAVAEADSQENAEEAAADGAPGQEGEEQAGAEADPLAAEEQAGAETDPLAAEVQEQVFTAGELVFHGTDYDVTLAYDENAKIPAAAQLNVREIEKGTSEYESYLAGAEAAAGKGVAEARFFDITIWAAGTDGQQQEIQPQSPVRVSITYHSAIEVADEGEVQAMHFENGTADAEVVSSDTNGGSEVSEIAFDAASFSVYGVVYTVTFTYSGYTFSMPGEGSIYLSELAEILNLYETDLDRAFSVQNVESVTFTSKELLKTEKQADGDWLLTSLASFTSEETLTVTMVDGTKFLIEVTDPPAENHGEGSTDLRATLDSVTITGNGETYDADGQVTLVKGIRYRIDLSFMETDDNQFVDDDTTMTYVLPTNFSVVGSTSGTFDMEFGSLGTLKENPYVIEGNLLKVNWNTRDTAMMDILRAADNAHFSISVWCVFESDSDRIEWSDEIVTELDLEELHNANVSKRGSYNKDTDSIDYVVTVTSEGTTSGVKITDTITGSALISNVHSIDDITVLKNGTPVTLSADSLSVSGNSFELNLPDMANEDKYEIRYSARVNYDALGGNGKTKSTETNNKVELDYEENPDPPKESSSYEYEIHYSSIAKTYTDVSEIIEIDGRQYRRISWEVVANTEKKATIDHITDTVRADSQSRMKMDGDGITITVSKEDGTTQTRTLNWGADGPDGKLVKNSDYSWTYNPPASDGKAAYTITYQTIADITSLTDVVNVNNDVDDGHGKTGAGTTVGPDREDISVVKSVAAVSAEEVTWDINVTIPETGTSYTRITDYLPINTQAGYLDIYKSCSVTGLQPDESYEVTYGFGRIAYGSFVLAYEGTEPRDPEDVIGEVYINFYHTEGDNKVSGLKATGTERNIQAEIVTENLKEWLEAAQKNYWSFYQHTNTAKFGDITATAIAEPALMKIKKEFKLRTDVKLKDGKTYPCYLYEVIMEGVSDDRLEIFDTFDTEVFEILNLDDTDYPDYNPFLPANQGHGYIEDRKNTTTMEKVDSHVAQFTATDSGALISTTGLDRRDSGLLYPSYMIRYYLVMKHPEKAAEKALAAGGKIKFNNAVDWEGAKSDVDFEFGNPVVDKSLVVDESKTPVRAKYTIVLNPDKLMLNNGSSMTMEDVFSSTLSIDYKSISITTDPAGQAVTYDYYGNTGVYQIPDSTKVTITYECNVIGKVGTVRVYNKATLNEKYSDNVEEYLEIDSEGGGGASIIYLDLLKYASGNMQEGSLAGAKFRLLDSEKNPVRYTSRAHDPSLIGREVTFTTGSDGVLHIMLSRYEHGITIKKNTVFFLEEIEPPTGYQLDPTLYSFVVSADTSDAEYTREDGVWVYYVGDILKIRNTPETQSLIVSKRFAGNIALTDEQKEKIRFIIRKVDESGEPVTGDGAFTKTFNYSEMVYDKFTVTEETPDDSGALTFSAGYYKGTEEYIGGLDSLGLPDNVVAETTYSVNAGGSTEIGENAIGEDSVTTDKAAVSAGKTTNVIFTNKYSTGAYYFTKIEGGTEEPLEGAVFSVYKEGDSAAVTTYTTGSDGRFVISRAGEHLSILDEDTLYYVVETGAPEGFSVPDPAPKYYFYFGTEGGEVPEGAVERNAINLYEGNASEEVVNFSDGSLMVIKKWKKADGSYIPDTELIDKSVTVTLKRKTGTGEEAVVDPDFAQAKKLTIHENFYGIWDNLKKTDGSDNTYYYFVEETDAPEGFVAVYTNNDGIEADGTGEITITNTEKSEETGDLKVSKTLSGNATDPDREFHFDITVEGANGSYEAEGVSATVSFEDGKTTVILKGRQSITIKGLPDGAAYTVTEQEADEDGYATSSTGASGKIEAGKTGNAAPHAAFTNTRNKGGIKVVKTAQLNGVTDPGAAGQTFTVAVFSDESGTNKVGESKTITIGEDGTGEVTFDGLDVGTTYYVFEMDGESHAGAKIGEYTVVTGKGEAAATVDISSTVPLVNNKKTGDLKVSKTLSGNATDPDREFHFDITVAGASGSYEAEGAATSVSFTAGETTITLKGGQSITIKGLPDGAAYTVTEQEANEDDYTTTPSTGKVEGVISAEATGEATPHAAFTNTKNKGGLTITKTFAGNTDKLTNDDKAKISFTVTGPEWTQPQTFSYAEMRNGVMTFENIKLGTYTVTESIEEGKNYTTTYKVDSREAVEGTEATASVDADGATVAFTNTYQETEAILDAEKFIEAADGVEIPQKTFTFTLSKGEGVEEAPMPEKTTASVTGPGKVSAGDDKFGAIPYTKAGVYTYTITETGTADAGWTYNTGGAVTATVTVSEESETGALSATVKYDKANRAGDAAKITNKYEVGSLTVTKTFAGNTDKLTNADKAKISFTVTGPEWAQPQTFTYAQMDGGVKTFENIKLGEYTVTESIAEGIMTYTTTYSVDSGDPVSGSKADVTVGTGGATVAFTNTCRTGSLYVRKMVESPAESDLRKEFPVTVTLMTSEAGDIARAINGTYGDMTFENGVANIMIADGEQNEKKAEGLPAGLWYKVEEKLEAEDAKVYSIEYVEQTGVIPYDQTGAATQPDTSNPPGQGAEAASAAVINTRKTGDLTVSKEVVSDAAADKNAVFTFTVTLSDTTISKKYGDMTFANGIATVTLKGGENAKATGLPAGITYTVTETAAAGFELTAKSGDSGKISTTASEAKFTNTRETGDLTVSKKVVSDAAADKDAEFTFTVTLSDTTISKKYGDMTFTNGVATVILKGGESAKATGLPTGVTYTVTEAAAEGFVATVTKGMAEGEITKTASEVEYTNTKVKGGLVVKKTVKSESGSDFTRDFEFKVTLDDTAISGKYGDMTFTNGVATFKLKSGGVATAEGLPTGIGYTAAETAADGFETTYVGKTKDKIEEGEPKIVEAVNTRKTGDLTVSKVLVSDAAADKDKLFKFTVKLDDETINGTFGEGETAMVFTNGVATVNLKGGASATAAGLPIGITYTVTEAAAEGFELTSKTGDTGAISEKASTASFTNTRDTGDLTVTKTVVNKNSKNINTEFNFTVTLSDTTISKTFGNMTFNKGVATFTLKDGETAKAEGLPTGITYTVTEADAKGFKLTRKTGDTGTISKTEGSEAEFENTYLAAGEIEMGARKALEGRPLENAQFEFELFDSEGSIDKKTCDSTGSVVFDKIEYSQDDMKKDEAGYLQDTEITYTVKEVIPDPAASGYTYDEVVRTITVTLHDNEDGTITATQTPEPEKLEFTNTYEAKGEIILKARKDLKGRDLEADKFSFELKDADGNELQTKKNAADGSVTFDEIKYTQDDIYEKDEETGAYKLKKKTSYEYKIQEVIPDDAVNADGITYKEASEAVKKAGGFKKDGYTYDGTVHTITVELTDKGDGTIDAKVAGSGDDPGDTGVVFTNAYDAAGTLKLDAEKTFKNGTLKGGEFTFELLDADGEVLQSKTNDAAGNVSFDMIAYKLADAAKSPITYTVKEAAGSRTDVKYDATVYTVTVELEDKGDGTLKVTKKIDKGDALKFVNEQLNVETSVTIGGEKVLKGRKLKAGQFKFVLTDASGKWVDAAANDADGNFTFKPITYKLSDLGGEKTKVYTYGISEVKGSESGIIYDKKVYTVKVTVTDNGDGTMTAKADLARGDIRFVNTVEEKPKKKDSTKTGDEAPLGVLFGGLGIGVAGLAVLLENRRRRDKDKK